MTVNILLYGGISLIILGFILFIVSIMKLRQLEIEEFKQQQLHKAFMESSKAFVKANRLKKWQK